MGNLTTPLALIFTGICLYKMDLRHLHLSRDLVLALLGKLVICPLILAGMLHFVELPELMEKVFIIQAGLPCMMQISILGAVYKTDAPFGPCWSACRPSFPSSPSPWPRPCFRCSGEGMPARGDRIFEGKEGPLARAQRSLLPPPPSSSKRALSARPLRQARPGFLRLDHHSCFCPALPYGLPSLCIERAAWARSSSPPSNPRSKAFHSLVLHPADCPTISPTPFSPIELAALAAYAEGVVPLRLRRAVMKPGT